MSSSDIHALYELHKEEESNTLPLYEYQEQQPSILDWFKQLGSQIHIWQYLTSIFPITHWILHYNLAWLYADLVAGITVGVVVVPQSMSYATIAGLDAQYGLYSAFVGVFIYCFFATSKDVSIGPVAVMSLEVSKIITRVQERDESLSAPVIATAVAFICGCVTIGLGILRLGFILEFISTPAVVGFMTGSALNIISGQVPALMGYNKLVNTRASTYLVIIDTLKNLPHTKLDAVFGLIPLVWLYVWKFTCNYGPKRYPKLKWWFFYTQALRNGVILVVFTCISWAITRHHKSDPSISLLGTVPSGLRDVGVMSLPQGIMSNIAPEIPAAVIILTLEHISISKSFGRVNGYKIVPDQELIAIGATNLIGTFFNAYPATGSFSRSALKAKCNVKTPLAGIFTGACVLLALYCLTSAFYYIPKATLSAVIIHAVSDLLASYHVTWNFWKVSPLDCGIFIITVFITVFASIEDGIYFAVCASCAILLFNLAFPNGVFMGRVFVAETVDPRILYQDELSNNSSNNVQVEEEVFEDGKKFTMQKEGDNNKFQPKNQDNIQYHVKWVPLTKGINKNVHILPPPPGVLVFRPTDSWTYLNCSRQFDHILDEVKSKTKRSDHVHNKSIKNIDKPWNDPGPLRLPWKKYNSEEDEDEVLDDRPVLQKLGFDFSTVSQIDSTGIAALVDLQRTINKYTGVEVEFHFSGVLSPWIKKSLLNAGFGGGGDGNGNGIDSRHYVDIVKEEDSELGYVSALDTKNVFFHLDMPSFD